MSISLPSPRVSRLGGHRVSNPAKTPERGRGLLGAARPLQVDPPGVLRTQRMSLRAFTSRDRAEYTRVIQLDAEHFAPLGLLRPGEAVARSFDRQLVLTQEGDRTGRAWRRAAFLADGRLAGCFNLGEITRGLCFSGEASWWLAPDQTGRGLATEGVVAMLDHALADLPFGIGLHAVRAHIHERNRRSRDLAARVGMRPQGWSVQVPTPHGWESHQVWEISIEPAPGGDSFRSAFRNLATPRAPAE